MKKGNLFDGIKKKWKKTTWREKNSPQVWDF